MINDITEPLAEITIKIIKDAMKILEEKKKEEYTEEDMLIITAAYKMCNIVKERK